MKYNTAHPYFHERDIKEIILKLENILKGNGLMAKGPIVKKFEKSFIEYLNCKYGIAVNSGTSALEIVLKSIGIKKGDEVIVPVQTFVSTASSIVNNGGTPIFCGIDKNHLLNIDDLKRKVTNNTKAVIIVHFCGLIHPNIFELKNYLKKKNIFLIEDAAHAHGAMISNTHAGNIGDFGCFSFYSTKIMTTGGEGGFISTNNKSFYDLCASIGAIGIDNKSKIEIYSNVGSNNRMTEFQAIMGLYQLKRLESFIKHRIRIANTYINKLSVLNKKGYIKFQLFPKNIRHPYWRFMIIIYQKGTDREYIGQKMSKYGIKVDWPYQPLLHQQPVFKNHYEIKEGSLIKSERLANMHLCLPIHYKITQNDAVFIADKFIECF